MYAPETSCLKRSYVHVKNIREEGGSVIRRIASLLWLSGCENFSGPWSLEPQNLKIVL